VTRPPKAAAKGRPAAPPAHYAASLSRHFWVGLAAILVFFGGLMIWALFGSYAGAVIAPGRLVVESNLQQIQHPTGGVVAAITVKDGDRVAPGDILIRLDDSVTRSNLAIVTGQIDQMAARAGRLRAEQFGHDTITVSSLLAGRINDPAVKDAIGAEMRLLSARNEAARSQKLQLRERIDQTREEIAGLEAQIAAKTEESSIIKPELDSIRKLYAKNLVQVTKVNALQREAVQLDGAIGQLRAAVAQARGQIAEMEQQILSVDATRVADAMRELRETDATINELDERRASALDLLARVEIRAPHSGIVHDLRVRTIGGVIAPGEKLMTIVPDADGLAIEAKVQPVDIDAVREGQEVQIRMSGLNHVTTPELFGVVKRVGAELITDEATRQLFYQIRVELKPGEVERLGADVRLVPGMPAEVFVSTTRRTFASYLMKPIFDRFARSFREE
jgi:HlyD family secretion protein